jgi:hypothetical protein
MTGTYNGCFKYGDELSGFCNIGTFHGQHFKGMRIKVSVFIGLTTFICCYSNSKISYFVSLNCSEWNLIKVKGYSS